MTCKNKRNIEVSTTYIRNSAIDIPESTYSIPVGSSPLTYAEKTGNVSMERRFSEYLFAVMKRNSQVPGRCRTRVAKDASFCEIDRAEKFAYEKLSKQAAVTSFV